MEYPSSPASFAPIEIDHNGQPIERERALKKKRSLKRLFTRERQNENKTLKSPPTTPGLPPITPLPVARSMSHAVPQPASMAITSNEPFDATHDVWSHKRSISLPQNNILQDRDVNGTNGLDGPEPRTSTSTNRSAKVINFSRPSRDHRNTLSIDETRSSTHVPSAPQLPSAPRASHESRPSTSIYRQQAHDRLSNSPGQIKSSPPRPSTAMPDNRSSAQRDILKVPLALKSKATTTETGPLSAIEETRASMRSNNSTWSSSFDTGSNAHSSVFTKMGSVRDSATTTDTSDTDYARSTMTVEETVDLYARGFEDDTRDIKNKTGAKGGNERELQTQRIAQAMNESIGGTRTKGISRLSEDLGPVEGSSPPALRQPTKTHDQYGFRKSSREVTIKEYDSWWKDYSKNQARRTSRWIALMKSHRLSTADPSTFPERSAKVQRYVRKGVPPMWRGKLWYYYAGGQSYANKFPGLYQGLVESIPERLTAADKEAIDRDINRTFPDNLHYKPEQPLPDGAEPPMLGSLRRLLYSFAIHHPRIGYCQSLNFLAGLLLLFLPEEKAFWLLHIITARYLPGTHEISLEGASVDLWVLMLALKEENPTVWKRIGGEPAGPDMSTRLPPVSLCTTPWFMSLFIGTLPMESVLRVWDILFYDGSPSVFRAALAIFKLGESDISRVQDPMEIFQVVQAIPRKMLDATSLAMVATRRNCIEGTWLETKRRERRDWYAAERAAEKHVRQSAEAGDVVRRAGTLSRAGVDEDEDNMPTPRAAAGPQRELALPMGRHLLGTRSVGDLSKTAKSKSVFVEQQPRPPKSSPGGVPKEPLPSLPRVQTDQLVVPKRSGVGVQGTRARAVSASATASASMSGSRPQMRPR